MTHQHQFDIVIIGSGAAGLTAALELSQHHSVAVLSKGKLHDGSTFYAQGGIAAVLDDKDSIESHVKDTLIAGAGLCNEEAVRHTVKNSKQAIEWLISLGVDFTKDQAENYHLTREGGHSHRRIIHSADATGKAVSNTLVSTVKTSENIHLFESYTAVDLICDRIEGEKICQGVYALNKHSEQVEVFSAKKIIIATGGASKVYRYTSNPDVASGDGIAMAWRAGCEVANMEFNQFHPTCLFHAHSRSFLLTEALRGEGAHLKTADGTRFMLQYDERAELAPRDVVAKAIDYEMKRLGTDCVYLDISHKPADFIKQHFPNIYDKCLSIGLDMTREAIPVVPAAHYTCGGVVTDINAKTSIQNLYAIGEVAYTGLHGANRMASNSLLECLVFAFSACVDINSNIDKSSFAKYLEPWDTSRVTNSDEQIVVHHNWHELRSLMWDYVGIVRSNKRLSRAKRRIQMLTQEIHEYYSNFVVTNDLLELRNLVLIADLIVESAIRRKESRGLHYNLDYPETNKQLANKPTVLSPQNYTSCYWLVSH
jgi:L-aspartate oxidase